ncbi:F-box protein cpr30 [Phtheirospermum japonicum]|uniref:F-box protein cpr30 n=1 Tax=Phtheirospermum japonicum TaxID=374723 RepID=A0A830C2Z2_9LAMI|nr:F-box protein cpr30 [Phtheirospermum japonicum]
MSDIPPPEIINGDPGKSLPFDLIENILSRLPVKTLKRFRAVERSWCHLIDSERFARIHLHFSLTSNSNRNLISCLLGFYWMSVDSLDEGQSIEPGFEYDDKDIHAISNSCNGLVVVTREPEPPILWNPFSREHKVLPKCPLDFTPDPSISCKPTYGFGYDSRNDDYKVVKVMLDEEWIYSLKFDCWRRTDGTSYDRGKWAVHVNGALHTIVRAETNSMKIMGFSVVTERDYEVATPEGIDMIMKGLVYVCLDVLDECLALVCNYGSKLVIWVMEEYGVKESWTPLIPFPLEGLGAEGVRRTGCGTADGVVRPLAYSKERDKVMLNCGGKWLALCGLRTKSVEKVAMPFVFWPQLCVETLISPNGWARGKSSAQKQNKDDVLDVLSSYKSSFSVLNELSAQIKIESSGSELTSRVSFWKVPLTAAYKNRCRSMYLAYRALCRVSRRRTDVNRRERTECVGAADPDSPMPPAPAQPGAGSPISARKPV